MASTRILVADDHDLVRYGITLMLKEFDNLKVVGEACSGEEALVFCRKNSVDVVFMDILMPGMGGLEATRRLAASRPEIKVIALSSVDDLVYARKIIEAGAKGYLTKGGSLAEMIRCLHAVVSGKRYICSDVARELAIAALESESENPFDRLSPQEFQVATMVIDCHKAIDIGACMGIGAKTVNSYRYRIFEKLGVSSDVALTRLAMQHGIIKVGCFDVAVLPEPLADR